MVDLYFIFIVNIKQVILLRIINLVDIIFFSSILGTKKDDRNYSDHLKFFKQLFYFFSTSKSPVVYRLNFLNRISIPKTSKAGSIISKANIPTHVCHVLPIDAYVPI